MERIPKPGEFYRHIENKLYQIIAVAEHTETGEEMVVYQALYGSYRMYAEPLFLFNRKADRQQYPQAQQEYVFEPVKFLTEKKKTQKNPSGQSVEEDFLDSEPAKEKEDFLDGETTFEELLFEDPFEEFFDEEKNEATQWLEDFLDAEGYEKQLEVLAKMRGKVGKRELGSICLVLGIPVLDSDEDSQIANIKKHLETRMRYDTRRLR